MSIVNRHEIVLIDAWHSSHTSFGIAESSNQRHVSQLCRRRIFLGQQTVGIKTRLVKTVLDPLIFDSPIVPSPLLCSES